MAAYTSTQSGNFNAAATWGGGGWPSVAGDTYTVTAGHTVTVTHDGSGVSLGASTVNGTLQFATNANTALQHSGTITINNGGVVGNTSAVGAGYTAQLIWAGSDGGELLQINAGGKFIPLGTATFNMQSEAWASCYTTLQAQAASGQANISVPAAFANALRASGDVLLIQGTTGYTQSEIVTVLSKSGGTITLTGNLAYTHASGAYVCLLSRNFIVKGSSGSNRFIIDNDNTVAGNCTPKLTYFENCYELQGSASARTWTFDYCAWKARYALNGLIAKLTNCILAGENTSARGIYLGSNILAQNIIIGHGAQGIMYYGTERCSDLILFGFSTGIVNMEVVEIAGLDIRNCGTAISLNGYFKISDGTFSGNTTDIGLLGGLADLRYCNPATVTVSGARGGACAVRSQDHGRVLGAAKAWIGQVGTIERQNTVARSGYAAECTPGALCSSDNPLVIPFDIPCTHGDVITASIWVRVNSTYGTSNDPTLVLDPDGIYGCTDTSTEDVTAADTWTQLTVSGTANLGGAGVQGVVNCVLRIPYYVAGGKVYVDDFEVTIG